MTLKTALSLCHDFMVVIDTNCFEKYSDQNTISPYMASDKCHTFFSDKNSRSGIAFGEYYITESVFYEIVQQRIEKYNEIKKQIEKVQRQINISINIPDSIDFKKELEAYLEKYNIKILPHPNNNVFPNIIKRALEKKLPFKPVAEGKNKKGSDKGFKDVLLWETLLNYDYEKMKIYKLFFITDNLTDFPIDGLLPEWKQRHPDVYLQICNWENFISEENIIFRKTNIQNSISYSRVLELFQEEDPSIKELPTLFKEIILRNSSIVEILVDIKTQDGRIFENKYYYDANINEVTLIDPEEENTKDTDNENME